MRRLTTFSCCGILVLLLAAIPAAAQDVMFTAGVAALRSAASWETPAAVLPFSSSAETSLGTPFLSRPRIQLQREAPEARFDWESAQRQSFYFLSIEHAFRMAQPKTRRELGGSFFRDYARSLKGIRGWNDGDGPFANYVLHPMQGAVSGYIQVQNDPRGRGREYGDGREYWNSRLRALAWSTYYTLQFEVGLFSEASIGNVGKNPGTNGLSDFVVTPLGGMGMMVAEDALDRWVERLEMNAPRARVRRFYRILFNPNRSFANMLRGRVPWHRDTRTMEYLGEVQAELERFIEASAALQHQAARD